MEKQKKPHFFEMGGKNKFFLFGRYEQGGISMA